MPAHERFEWDAAKAAATQRKHGVSFELAAAVLRDHWASRFHLEWPDLDHGEAEERWVTVGSVPERREVVLMIAWTPRVDDLGRPVTRIISARRLTRKERRDYEEAINP